MIIITKIFHKSIYVRCIYFCLDAFIVNSVHKIVESTGISIGRDFLILFYRTKKRSAGAARFLYI